MAQIARLGDFPIIRLSSRSPHYTNADYPITQIPNYPISRNARLPDTEIQDYNKQV